MLECRMMVNEERDALIACCASFAVSKMTVPEPLGRPSAPMLMSARTMLPAERKRSFKSCQPAWYGSCDGYQMLISLAKRIHAHFQHRVGYQDCWRSTGCATQDVAEVQHANLALPWPFQSFRERAWLRSVTQTRDPENYLSAALSGDT